MISVEFGAYKLVLTIFSLVFLFLGVYPLLINVIPQLNVFDVNYTTYFVAAIAFIQLIYVFKMKRPRIY